MQLDQGKIVQLVQVTYSSGSTQEIEQAYRLLTDNIFVNYPKSFSQLQEILVQCKGRLEGNCLTAISNLIKISGQKILQSLSLLNKNEDDLVGKHKKLLHAVQHIFDNKEIPSFLKLPVGDLYVEMFVFFCPENFQRLVSKSKFYFNTKEQFLALGLIESYIHRKTPLKYRFPYCEQTLNIVIDNFIKKSDQIILEGEWSKQNYEILNKFVQVLLELWAMMTFEKFQSVFTIILLSNNFIKMVSNFSHPLFKQTWKAELMGIYNIITFSVGRCNLYQKFGVALEGVRSTAVQVFQELFNGQLVQQPEKNQAAAVVFLSSVIEYKMVEFKVPVFDLFTKLIYPNCMLVEKYLQKSANNLPEILNFLDDLSFHLQSQSNEVARHKIFIQLCRSSEETALSFKSLLYSFFNNAAKFIPEMKQIKKEVNIVENTQIWQGILSLLNPYEVLEIILLYSALSVNLFISDLDFMNKIEEMACLNQDCLLHNQNQKIVFYSTLLYKNYMDDVFSRNSSLRFREAIINLSLNRDQTNTFIQSFAMETIKEKVSQRPSFIQFSREVEMFFEKMVDSYDELLIPIMIAIFREYGEFVNKQAAIKIVKQTLHIWESKEIHQNRLSEYLQLIKLFLNIPSCSEYFMNLLEELLRIANDNIQAMQKHTEQFLDVMKTGLIAIGTLPHAFQEVIIQLDISVNNIILMESLNHFIMCSTHPAFFNWLAIILTKNQLNIYEILLIHNLIYFGSKLLDQQSITRIIELAYLERVHHRYSFDYRNGKINLIFLFLLKYMWKETNHVLLNQDWQGVTTLARERLHNAQQIGRVDTIGIKPFIEEIYDMIYLQQNAYRWKYDIQMFIINQLDLFKYQLKDKYQFMYANLSFIACTMNILRAYDFIQNHYIQSGSDSDDSLHPHSKLQRQYRGVLEILNHFTVPSHLKQVDYFTTYRKTVAALRSEESSCKWMEMLFQASFKDDHKTVFQNVMRIEKNQEGSFRKINRIRRMRQDENQ